MKIQNLDLYVRSMGKLLKVEAVFLDTDEGTRAANSLMSRTELAVVAATDGLILLADKHDRGHCEAEAVRLNLGDSLWAVRYRGEVVLCEESYTVASRVADGLNGRKESGEIAEIVERIRWSRD